METGKEWLWGRGGAEAGCGDWRRGEERYCGQDILYEKIIKKILMCMNCTKVDSVPGN